MNLILEVVVTDKFYCLTDFYIRNTYDLISYIQLSAQDICRRGINFVQKSSHSTRNITMTWKMFPFGDFIMNASNCLTNRSLQYLFAILFKFHAGGILHRKWCSSQSASNVCFLLSLNSSLLAWKSCRANRRVAEIGDALTPMHVTSL